MRLILLLKDIAMVAADTTRTICYLEKLAENKLLPNFVVVLIAEDNKVLPGQKNLKSKNKIFKILESNRIQYTVSPDKDINSKAVIDIIKNRPESTFIFSGFGGVLLKKNILNTGKNFLHVHGGYLPDFKGSTTNYFSLIIEDTIGASSIFLTKDIDSGPIIYRKKFPSPKDRKNIDHITDSEARAYVLIETLEEYIKNNDFEVNNSDNKGGETYHIIHPVLKHIAILGNK